MTPLELHTYQTPNGHKAGIMLEETGLPYRVHVVDIERGGQKEPGFLAMNPNNKIPVLVDPDAELTVWESGAILFYLADRSGVLRPTDEKARTSVLQWVLFQAAHLGPTLGQYWNYTVFADERPPYVIARFKREAERLFGVIDSQLLRGGHVAGPDYGIADVMTWPWIYAAVDKLGFSLNDYPRLERWFESVAQRPAVQRGLLVPVLPAQHGHAG